jgi:ankyrin repeat protein
MKYVWLIGTCALLAASVRAQSPAAAADVPPVMLATLFGDAAKVGELLKGGADPNQADSAGATALMWAVSDIEKTRNLLERGANINARSTNLGRTPFLIAAGYPGSVDVLTLLLERGADLRAKDTAGFSALASAMVSGDLDAVRFLVARGLDPNDVPVAAVRAAFARARPGMIEFLMSHGLKVPPDILIGAANWQSPELIARWITTGGDVNAQVAPYGATPLMKAASSEFAGAHTVQLLLERGADPNAQNTEGERALDWAIYRGDLAKKAALERFGAVRGKGPRQQTIAPASGGVGDARLSVAQSVALLLNSAPPMYEQRRCFTCHHNSMPAEAAALARRKGIAIPEHLARKNIDDIVATLRASAAAAIQGRQTLPGGITLTVGYGLMALAAEQYPLDPVIASHVHWMLATQMPDGSWLGNGVNRPPGEFSTVSHTTIAVRGLMLYPIADRKPEFDRALQRAAKWLTAASASTTEERAMRLMGLVWTNAPNAAIRAAVRDVVRDQDTAGGWSQLPALPPDAYATGLSLVALNEAGTRVDDRVYRRGVEFLLSTQYSDGAWLVRTRAFPVQPYFESGFPFDRHQWISAAGTAWAAQAIARTLPDATPSAGRK